MLDDFDGTLQAAFELLAAPRTGDGERAEAHSDGDTLDGETVAAQRVCVAADAKDATWQATFTGHGPEEADHGREGGGRRRGGSRYWPASATSDCGTIYGCTPWTRTTCAVPAPGTSAPSGGPPGSTALEAGYDLVADGEFGESQGGASIVSVK